MFFIYLRPLFIYLNLFLILLNNLKGQVVNVADITIVDVNTIIQSENSVFISPINPDVILNSNNSSDWDPLTEFF